MEDVTCRNGRHALEDARNKMFGAETLKRDVRQSLTMYCCFVDEIIHAEFCAHTQGIESQVCLVALGGYGRRELCPYSDIDILVLHEGDHTHAKVSRLVRALWDMGFMLGCVVRSIAECKKIAGEDLASDIAMLESRFITGERLLFTAYEQTVLRPHFKKKRSWLLHEMRAAFKDALFTSQHYLYSVEPDLKSGVCLLRDCQRILWSYRLMEQVIGMSTHRGERIAAGDCTLLPGFRKVYEGLLQLRCALHMVAHRRLDILEFGLQPAVAHYLGFGAAGSGTLMESFFALVRSVKQHVLTFYEKGDPTLWGISRLRWVLSANRVSPRVVALDGILAARGAVPPPGEDGAIWLLELFWTMLSCRATLSTALENRVRALGTELEKDDFRTPVVYELFKKILSSNMPVGDVISSMHDTGVLEKILPEFEALRCKVEYDAYHEFTTDQHSIQTLRVLDALRHETAFGFEHIYATVTDIAALRLVLLIHDIGKSLPGNHAYTGAVMASNIADRLGFNEQQRDCIVFLIENHLTLSQLTFRREPEPAVIREFAGKIGSTERLGMLFLLTVADIRSVGRKTWTAWKGTQLREIYSAVAQSLSVNDNVSKALLPPDGNKPVANAEQMRLLDSVVEKEKIMVAIESFVGFEQITIAGFDRPRFFADIVGCLSAEGYNILNARITTTAEGKVLDLFQVEPDGLIRLSMEDRRTNLLRKWNKLASGGVTSEKLLAERVRRYHTPRKRYVAATNSRVAVDNDISATATVVQISAPDQLGLLHHVATLFAVLGINVVSAKLSTRVHHAVDVFYVCGVDGKKIKNLEVFEIVLAGIENLVADTKG